MSKPTFHWWLYQVVKWCLIEMRLFNYSVISILVPERITPKTSEYALIMIRVTICFINIYTAGLIEVSLNQILSWC